MGARFHDPLRDREVFRESLRPRDLAVSARADDREQAWGVVSPSLAHDSVARASSTAASRSAVGVLTEMRCRQADRLAMKRKTLMWAAVRPCSSAVRTRKPPSMQCDDTLGCIGGRGATRATPAACESAQSVVGRVPLHSEKNQKRETRDDQQTNCHHSKRSFKYLNQDAMPEASERFRARLIGPVKPPPSYIEAHCYHERQRG